MKWAFWFAVAVITYTYFGYPAWLWLRSRRSPQPVRLGPFTPAVSVVMVLRNEEQAVERKLENLLSLNYPADLLQIVVVSDGSSDRTDGILRGNADNPRLNVVLKQLARGKASGLNDALDLAQGEIVVFTDARQRLELDSVRLLVENFADAQVGCASGELMLGDPESGVPSNGLGLYWSIEKQIREWEAASGSVVGATGAFYAARKSLLAPIPTETILDDVYIPLQIARSGSRVVFDGRAKAWDSGDLGRDREFARKVRTLSGNYQLLQLAPWLLTSKNPVRFEFVSHKLLRLLMPFALAVAMIGSVVLSGPIYRSALVLQLAFYGLGLLAMTGLKRGMLAGLANAAYTFVFLNTAALVAFVNFVTGRKVVWGR
jgi:biofilm PGA synthesis N-glycosyltransferase PgaC